MDDGTKSVLERAFELARSGRFPKVGDIKRALVDDHYNPAQIQGGMLRRQLVAMVRAARAKSTGERT